MINTWPKLFFPLLGALALTGCGTNMGPIDQNDLAAEVSDFCRTNRNDGTPVAVLNNLSCRAA